MGGKREIDLNCNVNCDFICSVHLPGLEHQFIIHYWELDERKHKSPLATVDASSPLILIANLAENSLYGRRFWVEVLVFSSNPTSTELPSYPKWALGNTYWLLLLSKVTCLVRVLPSCLTFMGASVIWQLLLNWVELNTPGVTELRLQLTSYMTFLLRGPFFLLHKGGILMERPIAYLGQI